MIVCFSPGSIVVSFKMEFSEPPKLTPEEIKDQLVTAVRNNGGEFGGFAVDMDSMSLATGNLPLPVVLHPIYI